MSDEEMAFAHKLGIEQSSPLSEMMLKLCAAIVALQERVERLEQRSRR